LDVTFAGPVLVIFHGAVGTGPAERMVARARIAAAGATAQSALAAGFEAVIVATDSPRAFPTLPGSVLFDVDVAGEAFDFESRLRGVVEHYGLQKPAVMGSGALPLLAVSDFQMVVEQLEQRDGRFVTNNFFSADLTAWTPGDALERAGNFARDNMLPRRLRDDAGLLPVVLPRTTATQFDLDTPADLCVLALSETGPPDLRPLLEGYDLPLAPYRALMPLFCDRTAEVLVAGRVGSATWQHLERETACRIRLVSEERGLAAAGPGYRARSMLGYLYEQSGPRAFFERLSELGDAVVLDLRVLLSHLGIEPSREDRFQADLYDAGAIADAALAVLVAAAREAPRPVLLGGHTLVSGGLMALNDAAWAENDRRMGKTISSSF
jgi:hypothetical protein